MRAMSCQGKLLLFENSSFIKMAQKLFCGFIVLGMKK